MERGCQVYYGKSSALKLVGNGWNVAGTFLVLAKKKGESQKTHPSLKTKNSFRRLRCSQPVDLFGPELMKTQLVGLQQVF